MAGNETRYHLLVEPYCILCRQDVTLIHAEDVRGGAEGPEAWEEEVFCFFGIPASGTEPHRNHMFRFKTEIERGMRVNTFYNENISSTLHRRNTILCYGCGECQLEDTANLVHIPCHQLAMSKLGRVSIQFLCDVAWLLRPMVSWSTAERFLNTPRNLSQLPWHEIASSTGSGLALDNAIERLPNELQEMMCKTIPDGPFKSLTFALDTLAWIKKQGLSSTQPPLNRSLSIGFPLSAVPLSRTLKANLIEILGEICLATLTADPGMADDEIVLSERQVEGVQCALGTYGVTAVRVHYRDGSTSSWLGKDLQKWTKFIRLETLQELFVQSDGRRILSLERHVDQVGHDVASIVSGSLPRETVRIIWDRDMGSLMGYKCSLIDLSPPEPGVRANPRSKFAQYLPFPNADAGTNSLTIFCSSMGISCVQFNGDPRQTLGSPATGSAPITFYLRPFEQIESLYVVVRRSYDEMFCQGPYLLVQTGLRRCLYYGPYIIPSWDPSKPYVSVFEAYEEEMTHRATGIFVDPGQRNTEYKTCFGVVQEPRQTGVDLGLLSVPGLTTLEDDSFCAHNPDGAFLSKGAFSGAKELKVQRENGHCIGVLADFQDGRVEILGRWDPARAETISSLYLAADDGSLQSITFIFSDGYLLERYVLDIVVNTEEADGPLFKWDQLSKEVVWYFTMSHDMLEYWNGATFNQTAPDNNLEYLVVE